MESLTWFGRGRTAPFNSDRVCGSVNRLFVDDVDERYATFRARGFNTTLRPESPIHTALVGQTWGLREFAVTDADENIFVSARRLVNVAAKESIVRGGASQPTNREWTRIDAMPSRVTGPRSTGQSRSRSKSDTKSIREL